MKAAYSVLSESTCFTIISSNFEIINVDTALVVLTGFNVTTTYKSFLVVETISIDAVIRLITFIGVEKCRSVTSKLIALMTDTKITPVAAVP